MAATHVVVEGVLPAGEQEGVERSKLVGICIICYGMYTTRLTVDGRCRVVAGKLASRSNMRGSKMSILSMMLTMIEETRRQVNDVRVRVTARLEEQCQRLLL